MYVRTYSPSPRNRTPRPSTIRIDEWDVWSLDHTLALIIAPALRKLKSVKQGVPSSLVRRHEGDPQLTLPFIDTQEEHDAACREWEEGLDAMIWSFDAIAADNELELFCTSGSYDSVSHTLYRERIQYGLMLFAHYYESLWD